MPNLFRGEFSMNWQTPIPVRSVRLWSADPSQPRRASWLELFFDLIFVAAVAQVGVPLGEDYTLHGLVRYALMFYLFGGHGWGTPRTPHASTPMMSCNVCSPCCRSLPLPQWPLTQNPLLTAEIPLVLERHTQSCVLCSSFNISVPGG